MDRRWMLAIVLSTGCSQLFGLDSPSLNADAPTEQPPGDMDGDGVIDDKDNCPTTPNKDQIDVDRNNIGDACEGCTTLALRDMDDDDGDNIRDTSDNCFGEPGMLADADGDGIGNACDERNGPDVRFCLWTFRPPAAGEDTAVWTNAWEVTSDFSFANSKLTHMASQLPGAATVRDAYFSSPGGIAYDSYMRLTGYTAPMVYGGGFEVQGSPTQSISCQVAQPNSGSGVILLMQNGLMRANMALPVAIPMNVSAYVRLSISTVADKMTVRCLVDVSLLSAPASLMFMDAWDGQPMSVRPREFASDANVAWDHITLYKLGGT